MRHSSSTLHPNLLNRYLSYVYDPTHLIDLPKLRSSRIKHIFYSYLPSPASYVTAFQLESDLPDASLEILRLTYEKWRNVKGEEMNSALCFAEWLMNEKNDGKEAKDVIDKARIMVSEDVREELDRQWMVILRRVGDGGPPSDVDEDVPLDIHV